MSKHPSQPHDQCLRIRQKHLLFPIRFVVAVARQRRRRIFRNVSRFLCSIKNVISSQMHKLDTHFSTLLGPIRRSRRVDFSTRDRILLTTLQTGQRSSVDHAIRLKLEQRSIRRVGLGDIEIRMGQCRHLHLPSLRLFHQIPPGQSPGPENQDLHAALYPSIVLISTGST